MKLNSHSRYPNKFLLTVACCLFVVLTIGFNNVALSQNGQNEIPPDVQAALFPLSTGSTQAPLVDRFPRDSGDAANRPQIPEKPKHSFNDSLFQADQSSIGGSGQEPPSFSRGSVNTQESSPHIGLTSFEGAIEYQPVMDRTPNIRSNQAVSIEDLPQRDLKMQFAPANSDSLDSPRRLPSQLATEPHGTAGHQSRGDGPPATEKRMPTLAELLEESNRELKASTATMGSINDAYVASQVNHQDPQDSKLNSAIAVPDTGSLTGWTGTGWTGFQNEGTSKPFVDTLQRIALSLVLVLFLGTSFIVIAKRWMKGTTQFVQPSVASQNTATTKVSVTPNQVTRDGDTPSIQIKNQLKLDDHSVLYLIEVAGQSVLVANDSTGIKSMVPILPSFSDDFGQLEPLDHTIGHSVNVSVDNDPESSTVNGENRNGNRAGAYRPERVIKPVDETLIKQQSNSHRHLDGHSNQDRVATDQKSKTRGNNNQQEIEEEMKRRLAELLSGQTSQGGFFRQAQSSLS